MITIELDEILNAENTRQAEHNAEAFHEDKYILRWPVSPSNGISDGSYVAVGLSSL
jgi:hypothetical protein